MAYVSNELGQFEIYVQVFPGPGAKWKISTDGGHMPVWSHDGWELFFIAPGRRLMSVGIKTGLELEIDVPKFLFVTRIKDVPVFGSPGDYDVSPDGQRFLINTLVEEADATSITLVLNWFEELKRLAPTN